MGIRNSYYFEDVDKEETILADAQDKLNRMSEAYTILQNPDTTTAELKSALEKVSSMHSLEGILKSEVESGKVRLDEQEKVLDALKSATTVEECQAAVDTVFYYHSNLRYDTSAMSDCEAKLDRLNSFLDDLRSARTVSEWERALDMPSDVPQYQGVMNEERENANTRLRERKTLISEMENATGIGELRNFIQFRICNVPGIEDEGTVVNDARSRLQVLEIALEAAQTALGAVSDSMTVADIQQRIAEANDAKFESLIDHYYFQNPNNILQELQDKTKAMAHSFTIEPLQEAILNAQYNQGLNADKVQAESRLLEMHKEKLSATYYAHNVTELELQLQLAETSRTTLGLSGLEASVATGTRALLILNTVETLKKADTIETCESALQQAFN